MALLILADLRRVAWLWTRRALETAAFAAVIAVVGMFCIVVF